jgi:hypothetical protein
MDNVQEYNTCMKLFITSFHPIFLLLHSNAYIKVFFSEVFHRDIVQHLDGRNIPFLIQIMLKQVFLYRFMALCKAAIDIFVTEMGVRRGQVWHSLLTDGKSSVRGFVCTCRNSVHQ